MHILHACIYNVYTHTGLFYILRGWRLLLDPQRTTDVLNQVLRSINLERHVNIYICVYAFLCVYIDVHIYTYTYMCICTLYVHTVASVFIIGCFT